MEYGDIFCAHTAKFIRKATRGEFLMSIGSKRPYGVFRHRELGFVYVIGEDESIRNEYFIPFCNPFDHSCTKQGA